MTRTKPIMLSGVNGTSREIGAAPETRASDSGRSTSDATLVVPLRFSPTPRNYAERIPVSIGVPCPRGAVRPPWRATLLSPGLADVTVQAEPLLHWPDGSVQWLLCTFVCRFTDYVTRDASLHFTPPGQDGDAISPLKFDRAGDEFVVDTGSRVFRIPTRKLRPFDSVTPAGTTTFGQTGEPSTARPIGAEIELIDRRGRSHRPTLNEWRIASAGPICATLVGEGQFGAVRGIRLLLRLSFFAGLNLVKLDVMLHNPHRARHRGGLWDLGDWGSILFRDLSVRIGLPDCAARSVLWSTAPEQAASQAHCSEFSLYQDSSGGENWTSRNHVNRTNHNPCRFRGFRLCVDGVNSSGLRASPSVTVSTKHGSVSVAAPDFWQQFPKTITVNKSSLRLGIFPHEFGELFELQGGERKRHTLWLEFSDAGETDLAVTNGRLDWVHDSPHVQCAVSTLDACQVVPPLTQLAPQQANTMEAILLEARVGPRSIQANRERVDEYGWRNYGDVLADHEELHYSGPQPLISHYNNQFDLLYGMLIQYMRTGERDWWTWANALARHVADIDIYHTDKDRPAYNGGLFWFTDHYLHAHTSTHRTYSKYNRRGRFQPYGGGPSAEHNFTSGLLLHYCLTGDPDSRDAVLSLANWAVAMDDGNRTQFGVLDGTPTGLASAGRKIGRAAGNSINALLDAWTLTGQTHYLEFAETLVRRCVHPSDDVPSRSLLDVERNWSYTVFLRSLAKYLILKEHAGQCDQAYDYARASLVHYATWMLSNERPYFDQSDKLEFPTEAWAAQELRKANVLRLAARYVDEPLRSKMLERGNALGDRAWTDLMSFETRATARALAIVMTDGLLDCTLRKTIQPPATSIRTHEFGPRLNFVSQRQQLKAAIRNPSRLLKLVGRAANPYRWSRVARRSAQHLDGVEGHR